MPAEMTKPRHVQKLPWRTVRLARIKFYDAIKTDYVSNDISQTRDRDVFSDADIYYFGRVVIFHQETDGLGKIVNV